MSPSQLVLLYGKPLFSSLPQELTMAQYLVELFLGVVYNLGPTLVVSPGDTLKIELVNELAEPIASGEANTLHSPNTTNIHLHGLHIYSEGHSDNVFEAADPGTGFLSPLMPSGNSLFRHYVIPDDHPSGTYWYHPHFHGSVAVQVAGGMAGAIIVLDRDDGYLPEEFKQMTDVIFIFQVLFFCVRRTYLSQEVMFTGTDEQGNIVVLNNETDSQLHLNIKNFGGKERYITVNGQVLPAHSIKQYKCLSAHINLQ